MVDFGKPTAQGDLSRLDPRLKRFLMAAESELPSGETAAIAASELVFSEISMTAGDGAASSAAVSATLRRVIVKHVTVDSPGSLADFHPTVLAPHFSTVHLPIDRIRDVLRDDDVISVAAGNRVAPELDSVRDAGGVTELRSTPLGASLDGRDVVVGIVDLGFDLTMDDFRDPSDPDNATRVVAYWDQSGGPPGNPNAPTPFGYGQEYRSVDIDAALRSGDPHTKLGTERLGPEAHGTHVAGIAAGNGESADANFAAGTFAGIAPAAKLVLVQPSVERTIGITGDAASFTDSVHVADAIRYVFAIADELGLPCVVNMSLGQNGGSHDGASEVEQAIDQLLMRESRSLVLAAGNEHIWRGHNAGRLRSGDTKSISIAVGGGIQLGGNIFGPTVDRSANEIEWWMSSVDEVSVRVIAPDGTPTAWVAPGVFQQFSFAGDVTVIIDSNRFTPLNGDFRIAVSIHPKYLPNDRLIPLSPGTWTVELRGDQIADGRFDGWIERDARDRENEFGDQAFFVGSDFVPEKTLGTPATSRRAICVANQDHRRGTIADSSSRGPTRDGRGKPDVAAPGTNIVSTNSRGGTVIDRVTLPVRTSMSGTSMAAPVVAGIVALMLQKQPRLTASQIAAILRASAQRSVQRSNQGSNQGSTQGSGGGEVFDPATGYGTVNAAAAIKMVDQFF